MAKKLFTTTYMTNIANSIRTKLGVATQYKVSEMAAAIDSIPTTGTQPQLYAPTISISSDYVYITPSDSNGDFNNGCSYLLYEGETLLTTTTDTQILLHSYITTETSHNFYVKQAHTNFQTSEASNTATWVRREGLAITAENGDIEIAVQVIGTITNALSVSYQSGEDWIEWFNGTTGSSTSITIPSGSTLQIWNETPTWGESSENYPVLNIYTNGTGQATISGAINALLNGTTATGKEFCFYKLFSERTAIVSARNLTLPAMSIANSAYAQMFEGCSNLVSAPDLPATTLANNAYYRMFYNCSNLSTGPEILPAYGTLPEGCYKQMFYGCARLATAPERFGTTQHPNVNMGVQSCYQMFYGCSALITPPLFGGATIGESGCREMFKGCATLNISTQRYSTSYGQFTMIPLEASVRDNGVTNMFEGCSFRGTVSWSDTGTPDFGIFLFYNPL